MDTQYGGLNKMSNSGLNMSRRIRRTPYTEKVIEAGVSGFTVVNHMLLPKSYKATVEEDYWHLSKNTQIWDVSCQRQVQLTGKDAFKLIQKLTPRPLKNMETGKCFYIPMLNENAGMINDPVLLKLDDDMFWISIADSDILLWAKGYALGLNLNVNIYYNFLNVEFPKNSKNLEINFIDNKDNFNEEEWKSLYRLSENTFVEETDSLKKGAAGAGLTDND